MEALEVELEAKEKNEWEQAHALHKATADAAKDAASTASDELLGELERIKAEHAAAAAKVGPSTRLDRPGTFACVSGTGSYVSAARLPSLSTFLTHPLCSTCKW